MVQVQNILCNSWILMIQILIIPCRPLLITPLFSPNFWRLEVVEKAGPLEMFLCIGSFFGCGDMVPFPKDEIPLPYFSSLR